jgi:hypothetical protein
MVRVQSPLPKFPRTLGTVVDAVQHAVRGQIDQCLYHLLIRLHNESPITTLSTPWLRGTSTMRLSNDKSGVFKGAPAIE